MSDRDDKHTAWKIPPSHYAAQRIAQYSRSLVPQSVYVSMRDGCRLAVDVYLPLGDMAPPQVPTIVLFTPYYRRFATDGSVAEAAPAAARYRDFFVPRGYAVVVVDVRGTGASFGTRDSLRSPTEREDFGEIAQWIVEQPWSDGIIGSTGISYVGAAACFLASTGHPSVKAIAPLFGVSDIYSEQLYPGGLLSMTWTGPYDQLMLAMDHDRRDLITAFSYYADPGLQGPHPVDGDSDGVLLAAAIDAHRDNFSLREAAGELAFRDDALWHDPDLHLAACSPYTYLAAIPKNVPIYSISGWFDGAGYSNGAITRWLTRGQADDRLLLGPWDHGARTNVSPWRDDAAPQFDLLAELLRFFDTHLMQLPTGLSDEAPVHYFDMHTERWLAESQWPPRASTLTVYPDASAASLSITPPAATQCDYDVRFATTTGRNTRYERLGAAGIVDYYPDWAEQQSSMLCFTSEHLTAPMALRGHTVATLSLAIDQGDAAIFVYLSEVDADDKVHYMTEGMLRAIHRRTATAPDDYLTCWPFRRFSRAEAQRVEKGVFNDYVIPLLPISWTLSAGSRLRVSIAGADQGHFPQTPYGRPPRLTLAGGANASRIDLPIAAD